VISMIEAHPDANIVFGGQLRQAKQLLDVPCRRFLDEYMDSGADGGARNLDLRILRCGDDDCVNIGTFQQLPPIAAGYAAATQGRDVGRTQQVRIGAMDQARTPQMLSARSADRTTANNTDVQPPFPQGMPRSLGMMRRRV
jgi:hypothetical protein